MNVLSLFDGISCGQVALDRAGIKVDIYFASEIDKHAIKVTQHNYPNTIQIGDVTKIDCSLLPKIDLLLGGSPCTNFSFAGNRKGMVTKDNEEITNLTRYLELKAEGFEFQGQSYLFWEYVKILNEVKPTYFLLENVKMAKKWQKIISDTLDCEPILINSALVSAQNRKRLYWTNIPNVTQPEDKNIHLVHVLDNLGYTNPAAIRGRYVKNKTIQFLEVSEKLKSNCLTTCRKDSILTNMSVGQHAIFDTMSDIRYYSLQEFCKLQTIQPDYFNVNIPEYISKKLIGNAWTVDVIVHILQWLKINQAEKGIIINI